MEKGVGVFTTSDSPLFISFFFPFISSTTLTSHPPTVRRHNLHIIHPENSKHMQQWNRRDGEFAPSGGGGD
jgi:hypothetical protein